MKLRLGDGDQRSEMINYWTRIATAGQENYKNHAITEWSTLIK
jgi:hypothetical protein